MTVASGLQLLSIGIEALVCLLGIAIAVQGKKMYGYLIAGTFGIYIIYDFLALRGNPDPLIMAVIFFIATLSILAAVYLIYREG